MSPPFGQTRTRVAPRHALIAPDGHVNSSIPGVVADACVVLISPAMGARLNHVLITFGARGSAQVAAGELETAGYVVTGAATVAIGPRRGRLAAGGYFFAPAGEALQITAASRGTQITWFQKTYAPAAGGRGPRPILGDAARIKGQPFLGDPDARLQVLLPDEPAFDLAMNIFTYRPGATLPFVETHVMEHGLLMLSGQGVYRLEESWYPVAAGDAIWMAPYCSQWFVAMGKEPARYLYYKDVNRPPG